MDYGSCINIIHIPKFTPLKQFVVAQLDVQSPIVDAAVGGQRRTHCATHTYGLGDSAQSSEQSSWQVP